MGSTKYRSWSHTHSEHLRTCPRRTYYEYYSKGDKEEHFIRTLRGVKTPASIAGTIVHDMIVLGLRQLKRINQFPKDLEYLGLKKFKEVLAISKQIAETIRAGKPVYRRGDVMVHHLYGAVDDDAEEAGRQTIEESLNFFQTSDALYWFKHSGSKRWMTILNSTEDVPFFETSEKLGFKRALGLRIYTAYDFARWVGQDYEIYDWKTGFRTPPGETRARRQLCVYALGAMAEGIPLENILAIPYWLAPGEKVKPERFWKEETMHIVERIEEDFVQEASMIKPVVSKFGLIEAYKANKRDFPTKPSAQNCRFCSYRPLCPEGNAVIGLKTTTPNSV